MPTSPIRIVVGISGASGAIYGARLVEVLADLNNIEVHLITSPSAQITLEFETDYDLETLKSMAHASYDNGDLGAALASGTFVTAGMVVAPCSIKTLSSVANSYADTLIARAADVCLKERRRLVLVVRETPLHTGHLRLMTQVTQAGGVVLPPVPGFYVRPKNIQEIVDHTVTKVLDQFGLDVDLVSRWTGREFRNG